MKLSIVIPVWNTGKNAAKLIENLLGQYDDLEIIAVDDESTDDSLERLEKISRSSLARGRMKVVHQKNMGASGARNTGMKLARGEYLMFLDSDDEVKDGALRKMVDEMERGARARDVRPVVAVVGMEYRRLTQGQTKEVYTSPLRRRRKNESLAEYVLYLLLVDGRMYSAVNKIFRTKIVQENGLEFEVGRKFAEDTNFVLEYLRSTVQVLEGGSRGAGADVPLGVSGEGMPGEIVADEIAPRGIAFILEPLYVYNYGTETSTVKASAADWKNWQKSYDDLKKWAAEMEGGKMSVRAWGLLRLIKLRWRVSHYRAVRRTR